MEGNLQEGCIAKFSDVVDLYKPEASKALKKATKLTPSVLEPKSIEKTSVKLAVSIFCESTRDALKHYADNEGMPWHGTVDFITLVINCGTL
jgi:hypothetical protein